MWLPVGHSWPVQVVALVLLCLTVVCCSIEEVAPELPKESSDVDSLESSVDVEWTSIWGVPIEKELVPESFPVYLDIISKYPEFIAHFEQYREEALEYIESFFDKKRPETIQNMEKLETALLTRKLSDWWKKAGSPAFYRAPKLSDPSRFLRYQLAMKISQMEQKYNADEELTDLLKAANLIVFFHPKVVRASRFLAKSLKQVQDPSLFLKSTLLWPLKLLIKGYYRTKDSVENTIPYNKLAEHLVKAGKYTLSYEQMQAIAEDV